MSHLSSPEVLAFNVKNYLQERQNNKSIVVVEIGHRMDPIAIKKPSFYRGKRAYIGIEAGLCDLGNWHDDFVSEQSKIYASRNIFFLNQDLGGEVKRIDDVEKASWYEGPYNTETILPSQSADEVFLGNVVSDPFVTADRQRTVDLLKETSRLVTETGMIVLRETITPKNTVYLNDETFSEAGLALVSLVSITQKSDWNMLEPIYGKKNSILQQVPGSAYRFLSKTAEQPG